MSDLIELAVKKNQQEHQQKTKEIEDVDDRLFRLDIKYAQLRLKKRELQKDLEKIESRIKEHIKHIRK